MNNPTLPNKYFAFISYNHEDEGMAIWFQHEMENYHLPVTLNGRTDLPTEFRPVFRDYDELKAGNLPKQIYEALASSTYLVVICSLHSAQSEWVNKEITDFIAIGEGKGIDNSQNIFPFIVEGKPHAEKRSEECYPPSLLDIARRYDILGGDAKKEGNDHAFVKVLAAMLPNVAFDELWNRYERDKAEEQRIERERRDNLLQLQSRFVAEKAMDIAEEDSYLARLLAVEVLPEKLDNPNRPYTVEAETALRKTYYHNDTILKGHDLIVNCASFNPNGSRVISASGDKTIRIWNAIDGCILNVLKGHTDAVLSAAFSPDGHNIVSGSIDKTILIWDADSGKRLMKPLIGHAEAVRSVAYSYDGNRIVSASGDGSIRIWNAKTGEELKVLKGHTKEVTTAVFSPDGKRIVSASEDGTIRIWKWKSGNNELIIKKNHRGSVFSANYSPDGKYIVSALEDCTVRIWNAETGDELNVLEHDNCIRSASYSPDGTQIVTASFDNTIHIWDVSTCVELKILKGHTHMVTHAAFSPDGRRVISASFDKTVRIWDVALYRELKIIKSHKEIVTSAEFSPDGKNIVSVSAGNIVRFWDVSTCRELGETIIRVGNDYSSKHDLELLKSNNIAQDWVKNHVGNFTQNSNHVGFSPDGTCVVRASWDGTIVLWNSETEKKIMLEGHKGSVNSAFFSPDGTRVVSASADRTIRIWDVDSRKELEVLEGHFSSVNDARFSQDGRHIVSSSSDGTIRIWDFPPLQELIDQTRERFKDRPLTKEEREQYYLE